MFRHLYTLILIVIIPSMLFGQFGKNKVQYRQHDWLYIQTKHFDIYFSEEGKDAAEFTAQSAEEAIEDIQSRLNYQINNRIALIVYNSHNEFQETNTSDGYLSQGIGGFTEPFKNRVVFPFEGSYSKFEHVIHHELVHAVMRDMLYGGTIQNIIAKGITLQLPIWYHEGMSEYLASGWETNSDMFIRDAIINEYLPDINRLSGYFAYRGGQALFKYIADTYGDQKLGELLNNVKGKGNVNNGFKSSIGIDLEELNEKWKKDIKKKYWPEIATRNDPDEIAKRLTDHKKLGGFYNISPAISPQGDKIVFISDREIYLDVYVMNSFDGEVIDKIIESGRTENLEELNVLYPALTWAPDNKRIALSSKSDGYDVVKIIDTETGDEEDLPFKLHGIESVSWSPDGKFMALLGSNAKQSDIYIYDFETKKLKNITNDIFSEYLPSWSPDSKKIIFSSDRNGYTKKNIPQDGLSMANFDSFQMDLYLVNLETNENIRLTDWYYSSEKSAVFSPNGDEILFVSDFNGIDNIFKKRIVLNENDSVKSILEIEPVPITDLLNGVESISLSADGKKLVFSSFFKSGFNVFLLNNPFEMEEVENLEFTEYMSQFYNEEAPIEKIVETEKEKAFEGKEFIYNSNIEKDSTSDSNRKIFTGQIIDHGEIIEDTIRTDYKDFVFAQNDILKDTTTTLEDEKLVFSEKLDNNGNFLVNKYKIDFSPDLIYANAGYSTLYGVLGTTILSFSDMLGNHRLVGTTSLQIDLKNSDYGLAYYYLPEKINFGIAGYHTARFVYLTSPFGYDLYRFRSYGGNFSASLPLNTFHRIDFGLSLQRVTRENLDNINDPVESATFLIPSLSYVKDNVLWGYTSPIEGSRYNISLYGNPGLSDSKQSFATLTWDFRRYLRFFFDNAFVMRFSGGYSAGANPQNFFLGGTESWINRTFATGEVPLNSASDFVFLTPALPLRGYNYAEQLGTKYSLVNLELRLPLIRYLLTGPIPLFFQNILGVAFIDAGSAWNDNSKLKLFGKSEEGKFITNDLLIGTGVGFRLYLIFLWKFDVAWSYDMQKFSVPKYYISIGLDF
ncbi:MAG: PD40 domain-containing protein [Ignavibacteriae bacterium]|nr:PD40 domain-containing protein [Ignavibacteriota bacterium]